jgi:RNA polymerase sigma factor (TIGR02999 family)
MSQAVPHQTENAVERRAALDALVPGAYDELLAIARRQLAREFGERSIEAASLVHEAYAKISANPPRVEDRARLLAIAAHAMRQVLVDHARARHAAKRGGERARVTLTDGAAVTEVDETQLLELDDVIGRLEPRQRQVVECRFFGGMDDEAIADALGVTARTVQRDWTKARAWLGRWLAEAPPRG